MKRVVFFLFVALSTVGCASAQEQVKSMDAIEAIMTRSSVRSYTSQPVEEEKVEVLLRAAMAAPTGMNRQPWAFYVVENREKLDDIASKIRGARMAEKAPLAIVVCGDLNKAAQGSDSWRHDTSAATQNLLVAANALGLGAVWTAGYPYEDRMAVLRETLSIPENLVPLCFIPIGYPDSEPSIKDKWNPEIINYIK